MYEQIHYTRWRRKKNTKIFFLCTNRLHGVLINILESPLSDNCVGNHKKNAEHHFFFFFIFLLMNRSVCIIVTNMCQKNWSPRCSVWGRSRMQFLCWVWRNCCRSTKLNLMRIETTLRTIFQKKILISTWDLRWILNFTNFFRS